jgi:hypothetical protein
MPATVKITRAEPLEGHVVRFHLSDGRRVDRNFMFLRGGVFEKIWREPRRFRAVKVVEGVPTWPGGIDLDPGVVLRGFRKRKIPRYAVVGQGGRLLPAIPTTRLRPSPSEKLPVTHMKKNTPRSKRNGQRRLDRIARARELASELGIDVGVAEGALLALERSPSERLARGLMRGRWAMVRP